MFNLILFGPPGSGKGTQSERIIQKFELIHLSTGDLLRSQIQQETALGVEAKKFMDKGQLVPDEVVIGMISTAIELNPETKGFLFDGFPRTAAQAEALDKLLKLKDASISIMIELKVSEDELVKRLIHRGKTSGRADDHSEAVIQNRIAVYNKTTCEVAAYYREFNKVITIQGEGTVDEIFDALSVEIEKRNKPAYTEE